MTSTFINNQILNTTSNANNNFTERELKISPVRANFQTIDNSNLDKNNKEIFRNTVNKPTPLLADMRRYQDKLSKNNNNFEYRKISLNNNKMGIDSKKNENKSGPKKANYFENNSSYNKLVQKDKLNYSNFLNKTNNNETIKSLNTKKNNLQNYGLNFTNLALNSVFKNSNKENDKNIYVNAKEEEKRPASSNSNKIMKLENNEIKESKFDNFRKINLNFLNCKENEKTHSKNKKKGNKLEEDKDLNFLFSANVDLIIKCLKYVKFPKNYIDYYKIVMDKLQHSRNNKFLICVLEDKRHLVI